MCNTLSGLIKDCLTNLGSIKRLWFLKPDELNTITITNLEITSMSLVTGTTLIEYQVKPNSSNYDVNQAIDDLGVNEYTTSVSISINRRSAEKNLEFENLSQGNPDWYLIVEDGNGLYWFLGYEYGLNVKSISGGSGQNKAQGSTYNISLTGLNKYPDLEIESSVILSLI